MPIAYPDSEAYAVTHALDGLESTPWPEDLVVVEQTMDAFTAPIHQRDVECVGSGSASGHFLAETALRCAPGSVMTV